MAGGTLAAVSNNKAALGRAAAVAAVGDGSSERSERELILITILTASETNRLPFFFKTFVIDNPVISLANHNCRQLTNKSLH